MFSVFLVLITIVCFLLIVVIMVQNPKGGGLSSSLGGSQMMGGVQKTNDFLDKSTWTLATALIVLILLSSLSFTGSMGDNGSKLIDNSTPAPAAAPAKPAADKAAAPAAATETPAATDAAAPAAPTEEAKK
ncbi:preprotein translocase subunit SecG [Flavobacterium sp. CAU 1735]|uniref:preprotein translocase subunit SecG n=1 Tax=Flavobacterium sp. CAU 1735 TaxID=3140361 RepID=UPI003261B35C